MRRLIVALVLVGLISPAAFAQKPGTWTMTGSMNTARWSFTATLLPNGKVLVAGGRDNAGNKLSSAELYDPNTGTWTPTGSMASPREVHTATLLTSGKVLVAGGQNNAGSIAGAEIYDPDTGAWTPTGSMSTLRVAHVATLITVGPRSGMVLVVAGSSVCDGCTPLLVSAELYNPITGTWTWTGSMKVARYWDIVGDLVTLPDGTVLAVGGFTCCGYGEVNEAESYDPILGTWTPTSPKATRALGSAAFMQGGKVLVTGGWTGTQPNNRSVPDAELFDPASGIWSRTAKMSIYRTNFTLTLLESGQVLVAGGNSGGWGVCNLLSNAELYDPAAGRWYPTHRMNTARSFATATTLPNGQVLMVGGQGEYCAGAVASAELYTPG